MSSDSSRKGGWPCQTSPKVVYYSYMVESSKRDHFGTATFVLFTEVINCPPLRGYLTTPPSPYSMILF